MVGAVAVPHRLVGVLDARPDVPDDDAEAAAPVLRHRGDHDLPALGELDDVARDLGDRRRDDGLVGGREAGLRGEVAAPLASEDHVRVPGDRDPLDVVARRLLAALEQLGPDAGARLTLEQVPLDVQLALASTVSARQGTQHRPTPVRRRLEALGGQEVLDPEAGARAAQPGGHRAGRRTPSGGHRERVLAVHLMGHEDVAVAGREPSERDADERALLLPQEVGRGGLHVHLVGQEVRAVAGAVVLLGVRRHEVASRPRRVVRQAVRRDPGPGRHHPGEGLLHQVVDAVRVLDACSDDAAEHGHEVDQRVVVGELTARNGLGCHASPLLPAEARGGPYPETGPATRWGGRPGDTATGGLFDVDTHGGRPPPPYDRHRAAT